MLGVTETPVTQARVPLTIRIQLLRAEWAPGPSERALQRDALSVSCCIRPPADHATGERRVCWLPVHLVKQAVWRPGLRRPQPCTQQECRRSQKSSDTPLQSHRQRPAGLHRRALGPSLALKMPVEASEHIPLCARQRTR